MAAATTAEEYDAVRTAIQLLSQGLSQASVTMGDMSVSYSQAQIPFLQQREKELARRLSIRNVRKRTQPDFS